MMAQRVRALVIQHEASTPGGYVHEWLEERGAAQEVCEIYRQREMPHPRDYELIVSLGSGASAFDDTVPWLEKELGLLREAAETGASVVGICFGGQVLARALGGSAHRAERAEIGWHEIDSQDDAVVPGGPWFQWHFDTFVPPPGARLVASSPAAPQAFISGRSLGLQFHPEVTPEIVEDWVVRYRDELEREGVDPDRLLEETRARSKQARAAAWRLFNGFLAGSRT
jgi:GMP synthase (glutamine-hydrolysing)